MAIKLIPKWGATQPEEIRDIVSSTGCPTCRRRAGAYCNQEAETFEGVYASDGPDGGYGLVHRRRFELYRAKRQAYFLEIAAKRRGLAS